MLGPTGGRRTSTKRSPLAGASRGPVHSTHASARAGEGVSAGSHQTNGRTLAALSFVHVRGVRELVGRLPESSPGRIPAAATDVFGERAAKGPAAVLDADGLRRLRGLTLGLGDRGGA